MLNGDLMDITQYFKKGRLQTFVVATILAIIASFLRFYALGVPSIGYGGEMDEPTRISEGIYLSASAPLSTSLIHTAISLVHPIELGARLPSAIFGTLCVILIYFLVKNEFGFTYGIFAGYLTAISPTLLFHSRLARFDMPMIFFTLVFALLMQRCTKNNNTRILFFAGIAVGLSILSKVLAIITLFFGVVYLLYIHRISRKAFTYEAYFLSGVFLTILLGYLPFIVSSYNSFISIMRGLATESQTEGIAISISTLPLFFLNLAKGLMQMLTPFGALIFLITFGFMSLKHLHIKYTLWFVCFLTIFFVYHDKHYYIEAITPVLIVIISAAIVYTNKRVRLFIALLLIITSTIYAVNFIKLKGMYDFNLYKPASEYIKAHALPNSTLIASNPTAVEFYTGIETSWLGDPSVKINDSYSYAIVEVDPKYLEDRFALLRLGSSSVKGSQTNTYLSNKNILSNYKIERNFSYRGKNRLYVVNLHFIAHDGVDITPELPKENPISRILLRELRYSLIPYT